ncbi:RrF2 family transcriptional regulator [Candidatus Zixiibacteriota bacterium]
MILNRRGEYSILGMIHLAGQPYGNFMEISEVARSVSVPEKFLRILFHELVKSRLLRSQRGTGGGFTLARPAAEITLRAIVEAIQGPVAAFDCVTENSAECEKAPCCGLHMVLRGIRQGIVQELDRYTLADLAKLTPEDKTTVSLIQIKNLKETNPALTPGE